MIILFVISAGLILIRFVPSTVGISSLQNGKLGDNCDEQPMEEVIGRIIQEISRGSECMLFVMDSYYQRLINIKSFKKTSLVPTYVMGLRENEVFFPAKSKIRTILSQSKAAACNGYVILNANGQQASQFLKFAESERMINTHGRFLLIHDWRLFGESMKHVWNRIINVVFIRRFDYPRRRAGERSRRELINLDTVYYPGRVGKLVKTRYLDTWKRGNFLYKDHFPLKTINLNGASLRVAVFEHIPTVTRAARKFIQSSRARDEDEDEDVNSEALGIEFEMMKMIERTINFVADFYEPYGIEVSRWGSEGGDADNKSTDGLLGEAVAGNAAFYIGDLHYTLRHDRLLDLSLPYNTECLTFLTPEALTDNSWKLLIVPFRLYTWIALVVTLLLGAWIFNLFALIYVKYISIILTEIPKHRREANYSRTMVKFRPRMRKEEPTRIGIVKNLTSLELFAQLGNTILYTYGMLLQVSLPRIPAAWAVRVFIGWWWLYAILVTVAYKASLTATLANPIGRVTIDSVADLANSRIGMGGWNNEQKDIFLSATDDVRKIGEKFELTLDEKEAVARVANGTFAYYENIYVLRQVRAKRQKLEYTQLIDATSRSEEFQADRDLHIMSECVIDMPVSVGMDKNSPLKPRVDRMIRRIVEAGFVNKWLNDVTEWSRIVELRYKSPPARTLVNLHKLHGALVALGIGYLLSLIAFVAEIVYWKFVVLRDPYYDKYQLDVYYGRKL